MARAVGAAGRTSGTEASAAAGEAVAGVDGGRAGGLMVTHDARPAVRIAIRFSAYRPYCRVSSEVCRARRACSRASSVGWGFGLAAMIVVLRYMRAAAQRARTHKTELVE